MSKDTINQLALALRRWGFLTAIPHPEGTSPSVLAGQLGKHNQEVSRWCKELERAGLITLQSTDAKEHDERFKVCKLSPRGEAVISDLQALLQKLNQPPPSLEEPKLQYWADLKTKLLSRSEIVMNAAFNDLRTLCIASRVWMLGDSFWDFVSDSLNRNDNPHMRDLIECISIVQTKAANEDSEIIGVMKNRFSESLKRIVRQRIRNVGRETMSCLRTMLSTEDLLMFAKTAMTEAFKLENKDDYDTQYVVLFETLRTLYEKNSEDLRKWLYEQMENPNPISAKRSYDLYINLS